MYLIGLGTALPPYLYTQQACWDAIQSSSLYPDMPKRTRALLKKVLLGENGIDTRHFAMADLEEAFALDPDTMQRRFVEAAPVLAQQAASHALSQARLQPNEVDAVLISTCTGYLCPGLTSYVAERLGLRRDVQTLDLVGQGCGAALPNLRTAHSLLAAGSCGRVLSICVEISSAAFYLDPDPGVLISACLFGDGAAAAVMGQRPLPGGRPLEWIDSASLLLPDRRDLLRFEHEGGMLKNILTPQVPALAAESARAVFDLVAKRHGTSRQEITSWLWHAGGRDVLKAIEDRFELSGEDTRRSRAILRQTGNISSPFVLHVLERALKESAPEGFWWMGSFGAGFSSHGALWRAGSPSAS